MRYNKNLKFNVHYHNLFPPDKSDMNDMVHPIIITVHQFKAELDLNKCGISTMHHFTITITLMCRDYK